MEEYERKFRKNYKPHLPTNPDQISLRSLPTPKKPMKKTLAVLAMCASAAVSQAVPVATTFADGDLFVGFHNGTKDVVIDIGTPNSAYNLGNLSIDLNSFMTNQFSSSWVSGGLTSWAIFGTASVGGTNSVWASTSVGNLDQDNNGDIPGAIDAFRAGIRKVLLDYSGSLTQTSVSANGTTYAAYSVPASSSSPNAWYTLDSALAPWGAALSASTAKTLNASEDLSITYLGASSQLADWAHANISSAGVLTIVPEPSTYALMGVACFMIFIAARRKYKAVK